MTVRQPSITHHKQFLSELTRDDLKRQIKSAKKKTEGRVQKKLQTQLKKAQKVINQKRDKVRELQGYKDLLVPGPDENILTMQREDGFTAAVTTIPIDGPQIEQ